jgi:hypothetical protein
MTSVLEASTNDRQVAVLKAGAAPLDCQDVKIKMSSGELG